LIILTENSSAFPKIFFMVWREQPNKNFIRAKAGVRIFPPCSGRTITNRGR